MTQMKILHLDCGQEMRGGQHQVRLLLEALAARGHEQKLLARCPGLGGEPLGRRFSPRGFDIIHAHDAHAHTLAALWAGRVPFVVSRRVAFPVGRGVLSRWKYARAAHFLAISQYVARQLPPEKTTVVPDGVRLPELRPREGKDVFVVGAIATAPEKPVHLFTETAASRPQIRAVVSAPADISAFLFSLDAFVYLSESEGLGSAILQAMAHGVPVIASNVGGIPEIVEHRRTGLLVENSAAAVGAALDELAGDAALRAQLARAGREQVARSYTDAIMAAKTEAVYRKILGL